MITITESQHGLLLPVKAQPGARRNGIVGEHAGMLKVAVTAAPEKGKANDAILEVLSEALGLKRHQIDLVSGMTSPLKIFQLSGISKDEALGKLAEFLKE